MNKYNYIYLHGFTSSPDSVKAKFFRDKIRALELNIQTPDLNLPDFRYLTVTRQIDQVSLLIEKSNKPVVLIGASLGGLVSGIMSSNPKVVHLLLLAPAFGFDKIITDRYSSLELDLWRYNQVVGIDHVTYGKNCDLDYMFYLDMQQYSSRYQNLHKPSYIFHGIEDEVIPVQNSRDVANNNHLAKFVELQSNHSLEDVLENIWSHYVSYVDN